MKDLIEYIAKGLVESPEQVSVQELNDGDRHVIELHVAIEDRGKVIGKKGRMAHNMRTLLAAASPTEAPATLEIID